MRLKLGALMMTLLLVLTACGEGNVTSSLDAKFRQQYAGLTGFSARAQVTADYGERVYQYELSLTGDLTQGSLEVLSPENIAGTGFSWSDGGGSVSYEGVTLETGSLSSDGLSPTDAMPMILNTLVTGKQLSAGEQTLEGEETVFLELANPAYPDESSTVLLWLAREDGAMRRAEVTREGTTVVTYDFTEFTYTYEDVNQETEG